MESNGTTVKLPWIPPEIYRCILKELPLSEDGAATLARCSMASKYLREICEDPFLWKSYYQARYLHYDFYCESIRRKRYGENWRLLYSSHRLLDNLSLGCLESIVLARYFSEQMKLAGCIVKAAFDIIDALRLELSRPIPGLLYDTLETANQMSELPPTNLTRKFWTSEILGAIIRNDAILRWKTLTDASQIGPICFEESIACFSAFWGVNVDKVMQYYDAIAAQCRTTLEDHAISFNKEDDAFDARRLSIAICAFMRSDGFCRCTDGQSASIRKSFPHFFLNTHKDTFPVSLVCVFVAIARRLGVPVTPLNTSDQVIGWLCGVYVDVTNSRVLPKLPGFPEVSTGDLSPDAQKRISSELIMLVMRNIDRATGRSFEEVDVQRCVVGHIRFLFDNEITMYMNWIRHYHPLHTTLLAELPIRFSNTLKRYTTTVQIVRAGTNVLPWVFVGSVVCLKSHHAAIGVIIGWEKGWGIDSISVLWVNKQTRIHSPDKICPLCAGMKDLCELCNDPPIIGLYFINVEWSVTAFSAGRCRFIPHKWLRHGFPDDNAHGALWIRTPDLRKVLKHS